LEFLHFLKEIFEFFEEKFFFQLKNFFEIIATLQPKNIEKKRKKRGKM